MAEPRVRFGGSVKVQEMTMSRSEEERRSLQLIRTVTSEALQASANDLWIYPDPNAEPPPPPDPKAAKGAPPPDEDDAGPLKAENDPDGGGLFLSHVWEEPNCWSSVFGAGSFKVSKHLQVCASLQRAADHRKDLFRPGQEPRVWVDCASLPDPVVPYDHPLEELTLGTYAMPVQDLKAMLPKVEGSINAGGYTILHLEEGHRFEGTMNLREWDDNGRPLEATTQQTVEWEIPPGWYHVRSAFVIAEDRVSPAEAQSKEHFRPVTEQMRAWCKKLKLRDEVWVEFTLGSIRAECLLLAEPMLALHGGLLAVVTWNYFDRLWPFVEWTVFCARRGPARVHLAADHFAGPAIVEYHRAIRRISVNNMGCRDPRDRELLLGMIKRLFKCDTTERTMSYDKPADGSLQRECIRESVTDYSAVERYARATAIAVFAHEAAPVASRSPGAGDEAGWAALAGELGLMQLQQALKKCKPYDWEKAAEASKPEEKREAGFEDLMEAWWTEQVLPVLEEERRRAMR